MPSTRSPNHADPAGVARLLRDLREQSAGIALVAVDHGEIRDALHWLISCKIPIVTMLTDISSLRTRATSASTTAWRAVSPARWSADAGGVRDDRTTIILVENLPTG